MASHQQSSNLNKFKAELKKAKKLNDHLASRLTSTKVHLQNVKEGLLELGAHIPDNTTTAATATAQEVKEQLDAAMSDSDQSIDDLGEHDSSEDLSEDELDEEGTCDVTYMRVCAELLRGAEVGGMVFMVAATPHGSP